MNSKPLSLLLLSILLVLVALWRAPRERPMPSPVLAAPGSPSLREAGHDPRTRRIPVWDLGNRHRDTVAATPSARWSPDDLPDTETYQNPPTVEEVAARRAELDRRARTEAERLASFLSESRAQELLEATAEIDGRIRELELAHADDRAWESDENDERLGLLRAREAKILETLHGDERTQWVARMSEEADTVANLLPTVPAETRAQVSLAEWEFNRAILPDDADVTSLKALRESTLREALGEEGYAHYVRVSDATFTGEQAFGAEQGLAQTDVANLYEWRAQLDAEERRLVASGISDSERVAQLQAEARRARQTLEASLGPQRFTAYLESSAGLWLSRFEPGE